MTGAAAHLVYWGGLAVIALVSFGVVGGAVGVLLRGGSVQTLLLSLPLMVGGLVLCAVLALLWRGMCEFYLAIFRIADSLGALRTMIERETAAEAARASQPPPRPMAAPVAQPMRDPVEDVGSRVIEG